MGLIKWVLSKVRPDRQSIERKWIVELNDKPLACLLNPQLEDMFWVRFDLLPLEGLSEIDFQNLYSETLWSECKFVFRSSKTGAVIKNAFLADGCIAQMKNRPKTIVIRSLLKS